MRRSKERGYTACDNESGGNNAKKLRIMVAPDGSGKNLRKNRITLISNQPAVLSPTQNLNTAPTPIK
jgi:hypothetical protein